MDLQQVVMDYQRTKTRLILLDFDGTLVPFNTDHRVTSPQQSVLTLLQSLADDPKNSTILISGRDKEYLGTHFREIPITLVAEHGGYHKHFQGNWNSMFNYSTAWVPQALASLQALAFQFEGSFVEQKTFSLAWHYRAIRGKVTELEKRQILSALRSLPTHEHFHIIDNEFTIELRTPGIDKGTFIARWVGSRYYDFILAIGDSQTDEDVFQILGKDAYSIRVGMSTSSAANFYLESQREVLPFLQTLVAGKVECGDISNKISLGNPPDLEHALLKR